MRDDGSLICDIGWTGNACNMKECKYNCNNNGLCNNGTCACFSEFAGDYCDELACKENCNNNGNCF